MHIAGDMHGQGSHLGPQGGVGGQQGRHGEDLFEVFEDGQGLGDTHFTTGMAGVHQQRQQALGVEVAIGRQVLLAAILDQVDRRLAVKPESFPYSRHGLATWRAMRLAAVRIS
ncbi:hypothetical protein D3C84_740730 [compost metagenome]